MPFPHFLWVPRINLFSIAQDPMRNSNCVILFIAESLRSFWMLDATLVQIWFGCIEKFWKHSCGYENKSSIWEINQNLVALWMHEWWQIAYSSAGWLVGLPLNNRFLCLTFLSRFIFCVYQVLYHWNKNSRAQPSTVGMFSIEMIVWGEKREKTNEPFKFFVSMMIRKIWIQFFIDAKHFTWKNIYNQQIESSTEFYRRAFSTVEALNIYIRKKNVCNSV